MSFFFFFERSSLFTPIVIAKKFCIRRNKNKVNFIKTGRKVIAPFLPYDDQENSST